MKDGFFSCKDMKIFVEAVMFEPTPTDDLKNHLIVDKLMIFH